MAIDRITPSAHAALFMSGLSMDSGVQAPLHARRSATGLYLTTA